VFLPLQVAKRRIQGIVQSGKKLERSGYRVDGEIISIGIALAVTGFLKPVFKAV
jgi:hypothetical protein